MTNTFPARIGVFLPTLSYGGTPDTAAAARYAEELGFESVWTSDHLLGRVPVLDGGLVLAAAAAATERVGVGFGVLHLPLHPLPWTAKRAATLQYLSGDRLLLGVGSGGTGPRARWRGGRADLSAWKALDLPYEEKDARMDAALAALPALLSGGDGRDGGDGEALEPVVKAPPLLVGGVSDAALRRAARYGDGWFPSLLSPGMLASGAARLREYADGFGRPAAPGVTVALPLFMGEGADLPGPASAARTLHEIYRVPEQEAGRIVLTGSPTRAAVLLAAFAEAGAERIVLSTGDTDWRRQYELLAEARDLLGG